MCWARPTDGKHILGVGLDRQELFRPLTDIERQLRPEPEQRRLPERRHGSSTSITASPVTVTLQAPAGSLGFNASAINQVVPSPASNLAFITYTARHRFLR